MSKLMSDYDSLKNSRKVIIIGNSLNPVSLKIESFNTNKLLFSYDEQSNVVAVNYNGTYYYYLRDGQGNIIKLIDGNGATVVSYSYDPWGACTTSGTMASTLGTLNPFRYHGYVYDEETGWYYLSSRYYNPEVGRYLSADTLSSTG